VLGHTLAEGRGIEDGEQVLDIVAAHASTARHIATKLVRRFVSDSPPASLIDSAAATFTRTEGDLGETLRTIIMSNQFFSRAALRAKIKTPFEFVVSVRRALNAPADTSAGSARVIAELGQPTLGREPPDGWPDDGTVWMTGLALLGRINFINDATAGRLKFLPTTGWGGWKTLRGKSLSKQIDGVVASILGGNASESTRDFMRHMPIPKTVMPGGSRDGARLRDLLMIALSAPEFQRR
jgi:hypothetical protein